MKSRKLRIPDNQRGMALVLTLLVLVALTALVAAMSFAGELETERLETADDHEQSATDHADEQREYFHALHRIADAIRQEPTPGA